MVLGDHWAKSTMPPLDKPVFGVVVGGALDQATKDPFAQFQNCGDDEDSLTKLVLQPIKRNSDAEPREEAVRLQVGVFRDVISKLSTAMPASTGAPSADVEASSVAKLFEEVKVMFRDLPDRLQGQLMESIGPRFRRRRRFHPMMLMEMSHHPAFEEEGGGRALGWLMNHLSHGPPPYDGKGPVETLDRNFKSAFVIPLQGAIDIQPQFVQPGSFVLKRAATMPTPASTRYDRLRGPGRQPAASARNATT